MDLEESMRLDHEGLVLWGSDSFSSVMSGNTPVIIMEGSAETVTADICTCTGISESRIWPACLKGVSLFPFNQGN